VTWEGKGKKKKGFKNEAKLRLEGRKKSSGKKGDTDPGPGKCRKKTDHEGEEKEDPYGGRE